MTKVFVKLKQMRPRNRVLAAVLTCAVVLSAATATMVPLVNDAKAAGETPGTTAYYEARWEEAKTRFGKVEANTAYTDYQGNQGTVAIEGPWMLENLKEKVDRGELSAPWNGAAAGTKPTETVNGGTYDVASNPWKVFTAEQLRWCMVNQQSYQLQNDIDLGGYMNRNWAETSGNSALWIVDGNGFTIYNLYTTGSAFFGMNTAMAIKNLRFANSYVNCTSSYSAVFFGASGSTAYYKATIQNCAIDTAWVKGESGTAGYSSGSRIKGLYTSYIRNSVIYGTSHVAATVSYDGAQEVTNSFAADSVVISTGSHSGGFASCSTGAIYTNDFSSNVDMYCNRDAGNFYSTGSGSPEGYISNCFSSGKMEGITNVGGFLGGSSSHAMYVSNSYTTTMTGLVSGGTQMGSFVGAANIYGGKVSFSNCYAAGEVGSIDTVVDANRTTYTTVGGFTGTDGSNLTYDNCYYDKQTTGMREWETGTALDGGKGDNAGITGMLTTTTTKSGVGMTDASWTALGEAFNTDLGDGYYPQLDVFTYPYTFSGFKGWTTDAEVQELVRACSAASVSTVQLETWETDYEGKPLPETTYDTVRDITQKFPMTSASGTVAENNQVPTVDASVDLALGQTVTASSQYDETSWKAANVVDGNPATSWSNAASTGIGEWVQVDLGGNTNIGKISVSLPSSTYIPMSYDVMVSTDETQWETVGSFQDVGAEYRYIEFPQGKQVRYVRVQTTKLTGAYGCINSIEVYPVQEYTTMPGYEYSIAQWERCGVTGQGTLNTGTGAQSGVNFGESLNPEVIQLVEQNGTWMGTQPMPGIDWVRVTTSVGNSNGYRSLRICPTVGMDAGLSQYLGSNIPYDHADDVRLAYSTGGRMDKGDQYITYGVFPDTPLAAKQETYLNTSDLANTAALIAKFAETGQNNAFVKVDVAHMERTTSNLTSAPTPSKDSYGVINEVIIRPVLKENGDGSVVLGEAVDLNDPEQAARWNGEKVFSDGTKQEIYDIEYVWSLTDGRFLRDSKRVEVSPQKHNVTIRVENLNGEAISNQVYLDAYSISDGAGAVNPDATYSFGGNTKAQDQLTGQAQANPAATAWKLKDNTGGMKELQITLTAAGENLQHKVTIPASDLPTPDQREKTITLIAPYRSYTRDSNGDIVWHLNEVEKEYTITLSEDGVYNINFDREYEDYKAGVYVDDLDMDIDVVVVLNSDQPDVPPTENLMEIQKSLDAPAEKDQAFYFQVDYRGSGDTAGEVQSTMYVRVEIPAGQQMGSAGFASMETGWYTITELNTNWEYELDNDLAERNPDAIVEGNSVTRWIE